MAYEKLEKELERCMNQYPPDFEKAKILLKEGADINAFSEFDNETLFSEVIMNCEAFDPCMYCTDRECNNCNEDKDDKEIGKHYLLEIIRFFLDNGYDVTQNDGHHGSEALHALCWSTYDKAILEAAKMLLDAGANPLCLDADGGNVFETIKWKVSGCIPVNDDLELECLFTVLYDLVEAKTKNRPYSGILWCDAVYGRRIERIYSCAPSLDAAVFDFDSGRQKYSNCFSSDIIMECEGIPLVITHRCHAYIDPEKSPQKPVDLTKILGSLVGKVIQEIQFSVNMVEKNRQRRHGSTLQIIMDDGSKFVVQDNGDQFCEEYCTRFLFRKLDGDF